MSGNIDGNPSKNKIDDLFVKTLLLLLAMLFARFLFICIDGHRVAIGQNFVDIAPMTSIFLIASVLLERKLQSSHPVQTILRCIVLAQLCYPFTLEMVCVIFHTGRNFAIIDRSLLRADRFIGFDWEAYVRFFDARPVFWHLLRWSYQTINIQPIILVFVLAASCQPRRLFHLFAAQVLALYAIDIVAIYTPAVGVYDYLSIDPTSFHHSDFITRDKMTSSILRLRTDKPDDHPYFFALISFPSYHAVCAYMFVWSAWPVRLLRWPFVLMNAAMLIATPIHGSHYLVDVLMGLFVAAVSTLMVTALLERAVEPEKLTDARREQPKKLLACPAAAS